MAEAQFPFLACNIFDRATGKRPAWKNFAPSALVEAGGLKVGLVGATTVTTPTVTNPLNVVGLEFRDPAPEIVAEAKALRARGAALVVLVAHLGGDELFALLHALPPHTLDAAIAGHTHQYLAKTIDGVAVSEAGSYGRSFGWLEACVAPGGEVTARVRETVDVCGEEWTEGGCRAKARPTGVRPATFEGEKVVPDAGVERVMAGFLAKVHDAENALVGVELAQPLTRRRDGQCALGGLVARSLLRAVPGARLAMTNAGGLRADLAAGALRYGQIFDVIPFDNRVVGLRLTGRETRAFVLAPIRAKHGAPQLAGARVTRSGDVFLDDGAQLDDKAEYLVATSDFLADGGDDTKPALTALTPERRVVTGVLMRDALLSYLKSLPQPVRPPP